MKPLRLALALLAALPLLACTAADDDDSSGADDDDVGCTPRASGGSGGADGASWVTVPGWSTDDGNDTPDYEVLVYAPAGRTGASTLALLTANPVPPSRASIEEIVFELIGQSGGLDAWADASGFLLGFPVAGTVEGGQLAFRVGLDEAFLGDAIDAVAAAFDVDLDSVHLFGRSGGGALAIRLANEHAPRIASIMSLAGPQPFQTWPEWERPVAGLFIHDENDPIVPRGSVQDTVDMFLDAGATVETAFDYTGGHDWLSEQVEPRTAEFFARMCL